MLAFVDVKIGAAYTDAARPDQHVFFAGLRCGALLDFEPARLQTDERFD